MNKRLVKDFKGMILPKVTPNDVVNNIKYPVLAYTVPPKGIKIFIRSGHVFLDDLQIVRNQSLKEQIPRLLHKSKILKVTISCILYLPFSEDNAINILKSVKHKVNNFHVVCTDMVFEHSPRVSAKVRFQGLSSLFRKEEVDRNVKVVDVYSVNNITEMSNFLASIVSSSLGNVTILDSTSNYKFGIDSEIGEIPGAELNFVQRFKARIIEVVPKIVKLNNKMEFTADYILASTTFGKLKIPVLEYNKVVWDNRFNYKFFEYAGSVIPGYSYPVNKRFIRMLNKNIFSDNS